MIENILKRTCDDRWLTIIILFFYQILWLPIEILHQVVNIEEIPLEIIEGVPHKNWRESPIKIGEDPTWN